MAERRSAQQKAHFARADGQRMLRIAFCQGLQSFIRTPPSQRKLVDPALHDSACTMQKAEEKEPHACRRAVGFWTSPDRNTDEIKPGTRCNLEGGALVRSCALGCDDEWETDSSSDHGNCDEGVWEDVDTDSSEDDARRTKSKTWENWGPHASANTEPKTSRNTTKAISYGPIIHGRVPRSDPGATPIMAPRLPGPPAGRHPLQTVYSFVPVEGSLQHKRLLKASRRSESVTTLNRNYGASMQGPIPRGNASSYYDPYRSTGSGPIDYPPPEIMSSAAAPQLRHVFLEDSNSTLLPEQSQALRRHETMYAAPPINVNTISQDGTVRLKAQERSLLRRAIGAETLGRRGIADGDIATSPYVTHDTLPPPPPPPPPPSSSPLPPGVLPPEVEYNQSETSERLRNNEMDYNRNFVTNASTLYGDDLPERRTGEYDEFKAYKNLLQPVDLRPQTGYGYTRRRGPPSYYYTKEISTKVSHRRSR